MRNPFDDLITLDLDDDQDESSDSGNSNKTVTTVHKPIKKVPIFQNSSRKNTYLEELDELLSDTLNYGSNHYKVETKRPKSPEKMMGIAQMPILRPIRPSASGMFKQINGMGVAHTPIFPSEPCVDSEEVTLHSSKSVGAFSPPSKKMVKQGGWVESVGLLGAKSPGKRSIFQTAATNSLDSSKGNGWSPTA